MNTAWATAVEVDASRASCLRVRCRMDGGEEAPAVAYPALCGPIAPGDHLLLNTTALDLGLGTGGVHFVIANASAPGLRYDGPGHIVKLRYTSLQAAVLSVEEPDSPWHDTLRDAGTLEGMPVVCCELLSQVPAVLAGCRSGSPHPRVALVITEEAALPVAFSDLLAELRARDAVASVLSAGHAFGGDLEAVNTYSALLAARGAVGAEIAIVSPGPGTVGTGTLWGFGGVAQAEAMNAAHVLGGRAVGVVRASGGDARERHRGISHHTRTVFTHAALGRFAAAWPKGCGDAFAEDWTGLCRGTQGRMEPFEIMGTSEALDAFAEDGPRYRSMGRGRDDDPLFFEAAAAAGILARQMLSERTSLEPRDR